MQTYHDLRKKAKLEDATIPQYRLAIIGDCATQHIDTALRGTAADRRFALKTFNADYDQLDAQILDSRSELYEFQPDAILLIMCAEKLLDQFYHLPRNERDHFADSEIGRIAHYWECIHSNCSAAILQYNFAAVDDGTMGSYALRDRSSFSYQLQALNLRLSDAAANSKGISLIDLNGIEMQFGRSRSCDPKFYYAARMPFTLEVLPAIAARTIDTIQVLRGFVRKGIILDLDNTLWGGVIGDDGLEGIQIGELGTGRAFSDFQTWLKELKERGILLAVCSKNDENTAKEPFLKHPDMVLHLDDFVMFVANWEDKASNIRYIQKVLNIGMDSLVFIDDNPFERDQVRSMIPELAIPEMPDDPALYLAFLREQNLFETSSITGNDAKRTEQYREQAQRTTMEAGYSSYDDYLQALNMTAAAAPFDQFHFARIAQLSQRSNQFNLRTVRYTESQVEEISKNPQYITRYYTLKDKIGDYGLISVVILKKEEEGALFISEWLMSCRVLKRGMEEFIINDIMNIARSCQCRQVIGEYIQTPKNAMVAEIYAKMGFDKNGCRFYASPEEFQPRQTFIQEEGK